MDSDSCEIVAADQLHHDFQLRTMNPIERLRISSDWNDPMSRLNPAAPPDDDVVLVLCLDIGRSPIPAAEGTMARTCAHCGIGVWLSPATAAAIAGRKFELRCPDCLPPPDEDDELMSPTSGQLAEIRKAIGPEGEEAARRLMDSPESRAKTVVEIIRRARRGELS